MKTLNNLHEDQDIGNVEDFAKEPNGTWEWIHRALVNLTEDWRENELGNWLTDAKDGVHFAWKLFSYYYLFKKIKSTLKVA